MSAGDTARTNYMAVRTEIIQRMQLRDYVLLVFLGFTSAIFGVALGVLGHVEVLLSIPFLSLGAAILVSQHNLMAAVLGEFLSTDLQKKFEELGEDAPQWDCSQTFAKYRDIAATSRLIGHIVIIMVPSILALVVTGGKAFDEGHSLLVIWAFGAFFLVIAAIAIYWAHSKRIRIYEHRCWQK